ncbi:MAG: V-type ATP synthase subunit F [Burkholderiaceae bacterium]|jgi:vacuolar-type H+-ATPase subunit F/Vma7|nr:V-type ATP synthase subunit F [Burkholderiaceae bacterium]HMN65545.1 V-type ATP synthase subunit F [Burkholderiaceae bacterium]
MSPIVVIGDEATCAGFRLAGLDTRSPTRDQAGAEFERALASAPMIVLARQIADALAPEVLRAAMMRETPLVVVLPALALPQPDRDFARRMRAVLGIEA